MTFANDYESRVTSITTTGQTTNTFGYNGFDSRVSKVDSSGTRTYRRSGTYVTAPLLGDGAATYTPGVSERRGSATTYQHSALKNSELQTGSGQTVAATKGYDAFGSPLSGTGSWQGPFQYGGPFGYQSDPDTGLMLLGHRYYDPSIGRFLTKDPARDGRNLYVYCAGSPIGNADPRGLGIVSIGIGTQIMSLPVSGSGFIGFGYDTDTGHIGIVDTWGIGIGAGYVVPAPGFQFGYDAGGSFGPPGSYSFNEATGITILKATGEVVSENGFPNGLGGGWSLGTEGFGAGAYHEWRASGSFDISAVFEFVMNGFSETGNWFERQYEEIRGMVRKLFFLE